MSLAKIPFILTAALGGHISWTSPNPPARSDEQISEGTIIGSFFSRNIWILPFSTKVALWLACFGEAAVIICRRLPSSSLAKQLLSILVVCGNSESERLQAAGHLRMNRLFMVGWSLAILGTFIRVSCFRHLGKMFTFELTIKPGHKLVTNGPYSIVRHPSYTGGFLTGVGAILCILSPGSWIRECGMWDTVAGRALAFAWIGVIANSFVNFVLRTGKEDSFLKEKFEKEWEEWATKVPYRLVPGVY